jgi:hypothetical protein
VGASQGRAPSARGLLPAPLNAPLIVLDTGVVVRALTGRPDSASSEVVRAVQTGEVRLAVRRLPDRDYQGIARAESGVEDRQRWQGL